LRARKLTLNLQEVVMALFESSPALTDQDTSGKRDLKTGVYIGLLAALLIASSVGVDREREAAASSNIAASEIWNFYFQKALRRTFLSISSDNLKLTLAAQPDMPAELRQKFEATIGEYKAEFNRLQNDPQGNEGLTQLSAKAKTSEQARDTALRRRYYFEYGRSLYQMSIVVAVTALISGSSVVLYLSGIPALLGFIMLFSGFLQLDWLP
jgi:Domain of unknown function (DUF4337)